MTSTGILTPIDKIDIALARIRSLERKTTNLEILMQSLNERLKLIEKKGEQMGLYTTIVCDGKQGQVKLWNDHPDYVMTVGTLGGSVPRVDGKNTYAIAMREGGFVHVTNGIIAGWFGEVQGGAFPVYDKYGRSWDGENYKSGDPFSVENLKSEG
jgi:hypothetical protein